MFAQVYTKATARDTRNQIPDALLVISRIVLHTGRDLDQLTAQDLYVFRIWNMRRDNNGKSRMGIHLAWDLLRGIAAIPDMPLRTALRTGQRPTAELVDRYHITCRPIREVLIRYLEERRPTLDYATFVSWVQLLAGFFWSDIQTHHPELDSLDLPEEVAQAWKQRLRLVRARDGTTRPRSNYLDILLRVRAFYLDIQQWALEDPSWARWAVRCPVRRGETDGMSKVKKKVTAAMHQRVRERLPHLPILVTSAETHRHDQATLLATASATTIGDTFTHAGLPYRRITLTSSTQSRPHRSEQQPVLIERTDTGERINLTRSEDEAFWAWAIIETLRHTGVRVEELVEITHLALVSYRLPDTGDIAPMLQIVPSKSNEERLLLVSPELASVLATIITRLRADNNSADNNGTVALIPRYDPHEHTTSPALPHLFQRRIGWRREVISRNTVQRLLSLALARTELHDPAGQPLDYTPHDFRRMFATETVTADLPVHIAARLLGHATITTTQTYLAVFQDELIRAYRTFLDKRRAVRPTEEYREPTDEQWREFQQHFQTRKLELGDCGQPYATPCNHEHACIRCPMLHIDPQAHPRLIQIIHNLTERIKEAQSNSWLGEAQGLQTSLNATKNKLTSIDRTRTHHSPTTNLGIPTIPSR